MKPRIMFAVLSYGPIDPKVYNNHIARLVQWSRDYLMLFVHTDKHKCAQARNICVDNAMQQGATHLLFVDSDHILPENMLNRLMATGVEVSSGLICKRYAPFPQVGYVRTETGGYKEVAFQPNSGVHRVDICAMGCTLIDMKVFNKIEKPWFIDV